MIVQSRATAHVYRIFGALVATLLIMGAAVAVIRIRGDRPPESPYGALAGAKAVAVPMAAPPPASREQAAVAPSSPVPLPAPVAGAPKAAAVPPSPAALAAVTAVPAKPAVTNAIPRQATALVEPERVPVPRQIALDKQAANAIVPQPAPPAVVAAAAAAAAPPPPRAAAPSPIPHPPVPAAVKMASLPPGRPSVSDAQPAPAPASGRININTASVDQLNSLPGVGRVGRWIARHRPYRSIDDLVDKRVLKARDFGRIRAMISTD